MIGGEGCRVRVQNRDLTLNADIEGATGFRRLLGGNTADEGARDRGETSTSAGGSRELEQVTSRGHAVPPSVGLRLHRKSDREARSRGTRYPVLPSAANRSPPLKG